MMAGMLFALIPLRNAVPGSPPVGSIIDFASFFIAEAVIAISLISCVILGYRHEMEIERAAAEAESGIAS
jgi:glycerol-3-phosphate acyltransferase PlsY